MAAVGQIDLQAALERFGLSDFRRGQREVIDHLIDGRDCLCVMPTGGGKSLCYQLPSVVRPGLTIVVSPLIALMKDQVDALVQRGIKATLINSTLSNSEQNMRLEHVAGGHYAMVYVAPERLRNSKFLDAIRATPVQLLAIDEAHCISEWGHDFRPDYQRLGKFREALGGVQTIALTATATPRVRQDIVDSLQLQGAKQFITGFARENLYFGAIQCMGDRDKDKQLFEFLGNQSGTGIVYAATRKRCEALVESIATELKIPVGAYHAGLMPEQRKEVQEQFMTDHLQVIVATNAFGMGIDKADLRFVIHYNTPGTLEAYYQEAGRAGRDGLPSQCVLLYSGQDRYIQEFFIENANPPRELLQEIYEFLLKRTEEPIELTADEIRELIRLPSTPESINSALQILGRTTVLERLEVAGGLAMFRINSRLHSLVDLLPKEANVRRSVLRTVEKAIGDRREEAVYIHPRWLMQQLQMDRDALGRNLRELCKLECFEYVPPFRGRAIHVRRRDVPFVDLKIDHETLAARKKADYEKLDQMVAFAQSRSCRQRTILEYFGDMSATDCGICDRCQRRTGWPLLPTPLASNPRLPSKRSLKGPDASVEPTPSPAATKTAPSPPKLKQNAAPKPMRSLVDGASAFDPISDQPSNPSASLEPADDRSANTDERKRAHDLLFAILKGVERTHGYLSKTLLTQHLSGVESRVVQSLRLQRLPEFGIIRSWKKVHATGLLDRSIEASVLMLTELRAGKTTVAIGPVGQACLANQGSIPQPLVDFAMTATKMALQADKPDDKSTKSASSKTASKRNKKPLELPTNDQAELASIAIPSSDSIPSPDPIPSSDATSSSDAIPSSGPIETHLVDGSLSVSGWQELRAPDDLPEPSLEDAARFESTPSAIREDWRWTLRLVRHGYRLGECALIRSKTPDSILDDLLRAIRLGERFSVEQLFDRRTYLAIKELQASPAVDGEVPVPFQAYPTLWRFVQVWINACRDLG